MISAYVLVNMKDIKVPAGIFVEKVLKLSYVKEATGVYGVYDAVLRVECEKPEDLKYDIGEIRKIENFLDSTMIIGLSEPDSPKKEDVYIPKDQV
jgi:hypothetical protein